MKLTETLKQELLNTLRNRFEQHTNCTIDIEWSDVITKLENDPGKLESLYQMELTGGEPDILFYNPFSNEYHFYDCAPESPKGRRSLCYDKKALEERKANKPANNVLDCCSSMGIELLNETQYRFLQQFGNFDTKTSSWIQTPDAIRSQGGALFADFRYDSIFVYHNGASSYYAARGFRGILIV